MRRYVRWCLLTSACLFALVTSVGSASAQSDGGEGWIQGISSDSYLIVMADNTVWLVEGYYLPDTVAWVPGNNVMYSSGNDRCLDARSMLLVNVDDKTLRVLPAFTRLAV
jgi:hypothetical protein